MWLSSYSVRPTVQGPVGLWLVLAGASHSSLFRDVADLLNCALAAAADYVTEAPPGHRSGDGDSREEKRVFDYRHASLISPQGPKTEKHFHSSRRVVAADLCRSDAAGGRLRCAHYVGAQESKSARRMQLRCQVTLSIAAPAVAWSIQHTRADAITAGSMDAHSLLKQKGRAVSDASSPPFAVRSCLFRAVTS